MCPAAHGLRPGCGSPQCPAEERGRLGAAGLLFRDAQGQRRLSVTWILRDGGAKWPEPGAPGTELPSPGSCPAAEAPSLPGLPGP